jgi:spermidine/putrescine transport system ATP-binding protein
MGEVNVLPVTADGSGGYVSPEVKGRFIVAKPNPTPQGFIVVRPEFLHFVEGDDVVENSVEGFIYNEYSLGSRMQYQVRVGEKIFLLEQSRRQGWRGAADQPVRIGWKAHDAIFVAE